MSTTSRPVRLVVIALVICGLGIAYFQFTNTHIEVNDEAGYLYGGLQIAAGGVPAYSHVFNQQLGPYFTLSAFRVQRPNDPRFYVIYPPGYPLMIALIRLAFPFWENGMFYVTSFFALFAALGVYLLGSRRGHPSIGIWAALLLLLDPAVIFNGTRAFSDVPALACLLLGYALLLGRQRPSWVHGVASGILFGYACLIRETSIVALAGVLVWILLKVTEWRWHRAAWLGLLVSFGAFAAAVLVYNSIVFGGPFISGYAIQHHWIPFPAFSWRNFLGYSPIRPGGYRSVIEIIGQDMGVLGLLAALLGILVLPRHVSVSLSSAAMSLALFFSFYAWPASDGKGRFLLPTLAILRLFAAVGLGWLLSLRKMPGHVALVLGMVLILLLQGSASLKTFAEVNQRNADTLARIKYATAVSAQTEASSVFISRRYGDHFILYGDRVALMPDMLVSREPGRYREEEFAPTLVVVVGNLLQQGIPVYAIEDGMAGTRIGFFDPMPVLRQHFQVNQCPGPAPAMYRVRQTGTMKDEATGC